MSKSTGEPLNLVKPEPTDIFNEQVHMSQNFQAINEWAKQIELFLSKVDYPIVEWFTAEDDTATRFVLEHMPSEIVMVVCDRLIARPAPGSTPGRYTANGRIITFGAPVGAGVDVGVMYFRDRNI